jgi:hypothetical protein
MFSGASVASTPQICASSMLFLLIVEIKNYEVGVSSNGIKFVPSFVKICLLFQK